jgi:hypothetical protein
MLLAIKIHQNYRCILGKVVYQHIVFQFLTGKFKRPSTIQIAEKGLILEC